uniref:Uncharacterized protein n=1 Tax=Hyaloperonospora arabidopsidis (strain Emoy2) TaxID=559515 RepID=M4B819_HYAAE
MTHVNPERRLSAYALYDIGVLLPKVLHLLLAGLVCLARLFGHHGGHFAEGTWNRIFSPGCRQGAEVAGNAGYQTDHPRWVADAPGLGRSSSRSRQVRFMGLGSQARRPSRQLEG